MKNQIGTKIGIAAMICLGAADVAGAQVSTAARTWGPGIVQTGGQINPAATRTWGPGVVQPGTQMSPLAARSFFAGPQGGQVIPQPSGTFGNGFIPINNQMGVIPNAANGFNPFGGQMGVIPNAATGFNPFNMQMNGVFPTAGSFGGYNPFAALANNGYYGGYYGYGGDPTIAVTPYGPVPVGTGYNGYTGTGYPPPSDAQILRSAYAQGYQDAVIQDAQSTAYNAAPAGMTATPRGAYPRVPHGSDGVRMWRAGRGQVALRWQGDPRVASSVTFSVTDRSGRALRSTTVDQLPAEVRFTPPSNAVFYEAVVHYIDGGTNTIMGRLPQ